MEAVFGSMLLNGRWMMTEHVTMERLTCGMLMIQLYERKISMKE